MTEETKGVQPASRSLLEVQLSPISKMKDKIQNKVGEKVMQKIMKNVTGGGSSPTGRSFLEIGLGGLSNVREKLRAKFGKKRQSGADSDPQSRSMMEVGLGAVVREEMERSERTRIVRRNPKPTQQVHKTTNINIDIKGIFKKMKQASGDGGHSHHHETHIHQQQVVHHAPAHTGCMTCMHNHYAAYYGAYR